MSRVRMTWRWLRALLMLAAAASGPGGASADGGMLRVHQRQGEHTIAVFTSPEPMRAGPIDVSVLVQVATTGALVTDAPVTVRLVSTLNPQRSIEGTASRAAATSALFQSAVLELPEPGPWEVEVVGPGEPLIRFTIDAAPPWPKALTVWPWFCWPAAAVALFAVHRWRKGLAEFRRRVRPKDPGPLPRAMFRV